MDDVMWYHLTRFMFKIAMIPVKLFFYACILLLQLAAAAMRAIGRLILHAIEDRMARRRELENQRNYMYKEWGEDRSKSQPEKEETRRSQNYHEHPTQQPTKQTVVPSRQEPLHTEKATVAKEAVKPQESVTTKTGISPAMQREINGLPDAIPVISASFTQVFSKDAIVNTMLGMDLTLEEALCQMVTAQELEYNPGMNMYEAREDAVVATRAALRHLRQQTVDVPDGAEIFMHSAEER